MPKVLALRLNDQEIADVEQAAKAAHLRPSTWIKQVISREVDSLGTAGKIDKSPPVLQENAE